MYTVFFLVCVRQNWVPIVWLRADSSEYKKSQLMKKCRYSTALEIDGVYSQIPYKRMSAILNNGLIGRVSIKLRAIQSHFFVLCVVIIRDLSNSFGLSISLHSFLLLETICVCVYFLPSFCWIYIKFSWNRLIIMEIILTICACSILHEYCRFCIWHFY